MTARGKIIGGSFIGVAAIFVFLFLMSPMLFIEFFVGIATGDLYYFKGSIREIARRNEKLPAVSVEGHTFYCRMYACDFRFPLPDNVQIVRTNIDEGGFDTINGTIYISTTNGAPVDVSAYLRRLAEYRVAEGGSVSPAPISDTNALYLIRFSYFGDY